MSSESMADALIGRTFNGYRVTRFIARGGMGLVFEAVQESLNRPVAMKFLYPHLSGDDRFRERFEREARSVAQLNHPNIVHVLDYGVDGSYYYMIMDYIDGSSLRDHLETVEAQGLTLRTHRLINILEQISGALSYAHGLGFVHRDVKPGNILLGKDGRIFLADFGVVKLVGSEQFTVTGAFVGTPEYMSPEQATGAEVGQASDQYSLAIVAYEMLVGQVPFKAATPIHVMQKHLAEPPPPPSTVMPRISYEIDAIFARALAKRPNDRFASTREFVDELRVALASNPVTTSGGIATMVSGPATPAGQYPAGGPQTGPSSYPAAMPPVTASQPPTGAGPASYPAGQANQTYGAAPTQFSAEPYTPPNAGGVPPGPPTGGYPVAADANQPERRRGAAIAGGVLVLLLLAGVAAFFLFMNGDDDGDDDNVGAGVTDTATATTAAGVANPTEPADATTAGTTDTTTSAVATEEALPAETPTEAVAEEPTATAEPLPPMVVYYAYKPEEAHNPQIFVMNLDGTGARLFAEARGHSWGPITSQDGSRLMFSSVTREEHSIHTADGGGLVGSGNHDIYAVDVVGSDFDSLSSANLLNATDEFTSWDNGWSWTIDGEWITFTSDRPAADGSTDWEIYLMRPDGTEITQLTDTPYNEGWPVWTPDGSQIVYSSNETGDDEIYIMNADGSDPQRLTERAGSNELFPSVSPDGTRIVFSSQVPSVNEGNIWIMDIDGGNPRQLTSSAALNNIPSWCPAGDMLVFVSDVRGNDNVYIMNADGTALLQLTEDAGEHTTPHCSPMPAGAP